MTKAPEARPRTEPGGLTITPGAAVELRKAIGGRSGVAVRIWVEPGMHPRALMAVDRVAPHDTPTDVDGIPVILDPPSLRFLEGAQVRYWANRTPPAFEVVGPQLPALEEAAPAKERGGDAGLPPLPPNASRADREARIRKAWRSIYDPEIPMNIVDLGLIYATRWADDGALEVDMTMTSPGCPVADMLVAEVEKAAKDAGGLSKVHVAVVFDPPWGPDKMSELAQRQLGFL